MICSWSCTVFLSRPTLPGWEELSPGFWALPPGAQKAHSRPHRKGVLSSRRDLMVTGTRRNNARRPVVQDREDRPRPGPSGFNATGGCCPGREASAPSRLRGPRPLPRPLRPLNVKPPEGRRDPALLRTPVSPHGPPPPGPGHGPHKPQHAPRLLSGSLTFAAGSCQTTSR